MRVVFLSYKGIIIVVWIKTYLQTIADEIFGTVYSEHSFGCWMGHDTVLSIMEFVVHVYFIIALSPMSMLYINHHRIGRIVFFLVTWDLREEQNTNYGRQVNFQISFLFWILTNGKIIKS